MWSWSELRNWVSCLSPVNMANLHSVASLKTQETLPLTLKYNTVEGEEPSELKIPVAFNPNPRDLWKNIPTDENIPYYKKDSDKEYIKVEAGEDKEPKKDIVAASQRGRSHAQEGKGSR